ncbi:uncharacterized protein P174DRAFT_425781 [Aspergillus novofumigatus IBT 16806]|uniref:Uncharacterized protein n=1 Tax=Aspergillus novofumigatus (strain IBT 16806) TaxID=1392255 RepID=A0A2I1BTU0_ASPN1|nr:uncharacterized protein P174DRAFT_425781 [Aspergillus novofumigatus IBT 16806]PKX88762.1 hypothetical protein P174DRAFT_425781 [Aspergillus novofumigatus IBT 16806]
MEGPRALPVLTTTPMRPHDLPIEVADDDVAELAGPLEAESVDELQRFQISFTVDRVDRKTWADCKRFYKLKGSFGEQPDETIKRRSLKPRQAFAVYWMLTIENALNGEYLADDMGLGKRLYQIPGYIQEHQQQQSKKFRPEQFSKLQKHSRSLTSLDTWPDGATLQLPITSPWGPSVFLMPRTHMAAALLGHLGWDEHGIMDGLNLLFTGPPFVLQSMLATR